MTGTLWHEWLHNMLRRLGVPYMAEVNLNPWLPPGWGGTADWVIWNPELNAFVLTDVKTIKGEGMRYILQGGAKAEHVAQTSAYWHALKKMGIPLAKVICVWYLPMNETRTKDEPTMPLLVDFAPLPAKDLHKGMDFRTGRVREYIDSLPADPKVPGDWITEALEPIPPREQRVYFDKKLGVHEVKLVPTWYSMFCPYPDELCNCGAEGTTKIGIYDVDGQYYPRPGYEHVEVMVTP